MTCTIPLCKNDNNGSGDSAFFRTTILGKQKWETAEKTLHFSFFLGGHVALRIGAASSLGLLAQLSLINYGFYFAHKKKFFCVFFLTLRTRQFV